MATCPLCGNTATREPLAGADGAPRAASRVTCDEVWGGAYEITDAVADDPSLSWDDRRLLAGAARHAAVKGRTLKIDGSNVRKILSSIPRLSLAGQADVVLEYLDAKERVSRDPVRLEPNKDYSVVYGTHPDDLKRITADLAKDGLIERAGPSGELRYRLTLAGSRRLDQAGRDRSIRNGKVASAAKEQDSRKKETIFGDWIRTDQRIGGKSGQGDLFLAYHKDDTDRRRPRVLKRLRNPERAARFAREVRAGLELKHPGIVEVVHWDLSLDRPYLIMPYYRRGDLTQAGVQTLAPVNRLRLFAKICRAIGYAHSKGIVHRDIKPENILVNDAGDPVVADFGLCFLKDDSEARETETLEVVGSRFYKPPEVEDGRADPASITPASDVYSLGKLLYWMFSGRVFEREKHREQAFDIRGIEPRVAHALVYEMLDRSIVEKPERRFFRDGNELADAAETRAEMLAVEAHVLDLELPQPCHYCRVGLYEIVVDPRWWIAELRPPERNPGEALQKAQWKCQNLGLDRQPQGAALVLRCKNCGNLQWFDLGDAEGPIKNWKLPSLSRR